MASRDKVVTLAIVGGILLVLGVWTTHWWTAADGLLRIGLREAKVCVPPMPCVSAPLDAQLAIGGAFQRYANLTYWLGLLGGALLFTHAYLSAKRDEHRVGWAAGAVSAATAIFAIATVSTRPDDLAMFGTSWSFALTLIGAVLGVATAVPSLLPNGMFARARQRVENTADRGYRAVVGPIADLTDPPARVPEARVVDRADATPDDDTPAPPVTARYDDRLSQAGARGNPASPRGSFMGRQERMALRTPTREVSADTVKEALRFVAHRIELNDYGLHAYLRNGQQHQLAWGDIERVVMRHLPPDEPFRGVLMLDLVAVGASAPIRLLPTTLANYAELPDGAGVSSTENFKKLALLVRERNPAAVLDGNPPRFASPREFLEYDAGYGQRA